MTLFNRLISPKFDFTQNRSGSNIIKHQQSQALTSQFESFWSIVQKYSVWIMIGRVSTVWVIKWCFKTRLGYFARLCKSLQIIFLMSPNDFRNRQHLEKRCKPSKRKKRVGYNYKSVNLCRWTIPKSGFRLSGSNFNYTHMPLNNHNWPPPYKKPENHPFRHISSRVVDKLKKFGLFFRWNMHYAPETFIMWSSFYRYSDFMWNQFWQIQTVQKCHFWQF